MPSVERQLDMTHDGLDLVSGTLKNVPVALHEQLNPSLLKWVTIVTTSGFSSRVEHAHHCQGQSPICYL